MCLMKVKEEVDYSVPARVRTYKRTSRYASPPRYYKEESRRTSRQYEPAYSERYERYSSSRVETAPTAALPPPPLPPPPSEPPAPAPAPSVKSSAPPPPPSVHPSEARTRTHFVEVEHDADSGTSSSSTSSLDDLRSRTTHKTSHTRNTSHTNRSHRTSVSSSRPPPSEYSMHEREKEIRRERAYSRPRREPAPEYETYRYVNAPPQPDDGYGPVQRRSISVRNRYT